MNFDLNTRTATLIATAIRIDRTTISFLLEMLGMTIKIRKILTYIPWNISILTLRHQPFFVKSPLLQIEVISLRLLSNFDAGKNFVRISKYFNPSRHNPVRSKKIELNFYFYTVLWCLKRFYENRLPKTLEVFIKPFEAPQRSLKIKIYVNFILK